MKISIQDKEALAAVSPTALSAYARADGWTKEEPYGEDSDVYTREGAPEIIVPRTQRLGDYVSVVSRLIEIFAEAAETDALSLYRALMTADRDVVRVRAMTEHGNESVSLNDGVKLITGARDMLLAAARSLRVPRPAYSGAANSETNKYLRQVQLGQTEQGSFVVTLIGPVVPPPVQTETASRAVADDHPIGRQMTRRLVEALAAARETADNAFDEHIDILPNAVNRGVSANLCIALAKLIEPFHGVNIGLSWACTRPITTASENIRFVASDASILRGAARRFREQTLELEVGSDISVIGHIRQLQRGGPEAGGKVTLVGKDGRSVSATLNPQDYDRAIRAHVSDAQVIVNGDLERTSRCWRLRNPRIVDVILDEEESRRAEIR